MMSEQTNQENLIAFNNEITEPKKDLQDWWSIFKQHSYRERFNKIRDMCKLKFNVTDVATAIWEMTADFRPEFIAVEVDKSSKYYIYKPETNLWEETKHDYLFTASILKARDILEHKVLPDSRIVRSFYDIEMNKLKEEKDEEGLKELRLEISKFQSKMDFVEKIYKDLGNPTYQDKVIKVYIHEALKEGKESGFRPEMLDTKMDYIAFKDGIYSFKLKRKISLALDGEKSFQYKNDVSGEAIDPKTLYMSRPLNVTFEELEKLTNEEYEEFMTFMKKIYPSDEIREYLMKHYDNALRKYVTNVFLIHYNIKGANGKSTIMTLVERLIDGLFKKCNSGLFNAKTGNNPSNSNEALMELMGKLFVLISEPNRQRKLDSAFIKELTGGDGITGRKNYQSEMTFMFLGLVNMLCNKIPEMDNIDGGLFRRIKCIPYEAQFVEKDELVNEEKHIYKLDVKIKENFDKWRVCFLKYILEFTDKEVPEPKKVRKATAKYQDRENLMKEFINNNIIKCDTDTNHHHHH